jgi:hypothetical protein
MGGLGRVTCRSQKVRTTLTIGPGADELKLWPHAAGRNVYPYRD